MMPAPLYLGDGAYVHEDAAGRVVLTTGSHRPAEADNVIVLEDEVLEALVVWAMRRKAEQC